MKFFLGILSGLLLSGLSLQAQKPVSDTIPFGQPASKSSGNIAWQVEVDTVQTLVINELMAQNSDLFYDSYGDDDDWFEIYNFGEDSILLNHLWFTDNPAEPMKWKIDTTATIYLQPNEYFIIWADDEPEEGFQHANFKLSGDGEYIGIFTDEQEMLDLVHFPGQTPNISYGRSPDGGLDWFFYETPSPGSENTGKTSQIILPVPFCDVQGGLYNGPLTVQLSSPVTDAEIRYTLNADDPTMTSQRYEKPLSIDSTTILKARLFMDGAIQGPVLTNSYLMDGRFYENPVISIVAEDEELFGQHGLIKTNSGIKEVAAHMEYFVEGQTYFASGTGLQLHSAKGGERPTSMRFHARSRYGNDWFDFPFFDAEAPFAFKRLILRNSGNDNVNGYEYNIHFRDLLIHKIAGQSFENPLLSAGKPVNVFLNGEYFGLFNLRDRIDQFYIKTHHHVDESYDLLERAFRYPLNRYVIEGSFDAWDQLLTFADTTGDLSVSEDFDYVASQVDLLNYSNYWMTEVFVGNYDWLSNNVKFWKPADGKWQWIFWDLDHGLGLKFNDYGYVNWNTLEWSLTMSDRAWSNGFNNILMRNLLKNESYRKWFITHFATLLNTAFKFSETEPVLNSMVKKYENDMTYHAAKWNNEMDDWYSAGDTIRTYLEKRPEEVFKHLRDFFGLEEAVTVSLKVFPEAAGAISLDGEKLTESSFSGKYFPDFSYKIEAEPVTGYRFSQWTVNGDPADLDSLSFSGPVEVCAYFLPHDVSTPVQLTEVYFNNREIFDCGDWIEFHYYGFKSLDLSSAVIRDGSGQVLYTFESGTMLDPGSYFVIAEDQQAFREVFPDSVIVYGNLSHGLNDQPKIRLQLQNGTMVKSVDLMNSLNWPELPGEGYSVELRKPALDTKYGANWTLSSNAFGSPGLPNDRVYNFSKPTAIDSTFSNAMPVWVRLNSTNEYFWDPDHHDLAGIDIISLEGPPGRILFNGIPIVDPGIIPPGDLQYEPLEPLRKSTFLTYRVFDRSGEASDPHTLAFRSATDLREHIQQNWKCYPNPATDHMIIETVAGRIDPSRFTLTDLSGKTLLEKHIQPGNSQVRIQLEGIAPGIYFYQLVNPGVILQGKIEVAR